MTTEPAIVVLGIMAIAKFLFAAHLTVNVEATWPELKKLWRGMKE